KRNTLVKAKTRARARAAASRATTVAKARTLARARVAARPMARRCRTRRSPQRSFDLTHSHLRGPAMHTGPRRTPRAVGALDARKPFQQFYGLRNRDWVARAALQSHLGAQARRGLVRNHFRKFHDWRRETAAHSGPNSRTIQSRAAWRLDVFRL